MAVQETRHGAQPVVRSNRPSELEIPGVARSPSKIHFVWTRDIHADLAFGRLKMARAIRSVLAEQLTAGDSRMHSLAEIRSPGAAARALITYFGEFCRFRVLPLQCLLFADPREADRVIAEIPADARVVYVDGVRCYAMLRRLKQRRPDLTVVTDLDDLMSRRMRLLLDLGEAPSTGYMKQAMPGFVDRLLRSRMLARLLLRYESATLARVEDEIVTLSDRSVLVSREDARQLAERNRKHTKVMGIAPPAPIARDAAALGPGPIRFVFVGSDVLRQNQLTIDRLLKIWREYRLTARLVIFGEQHRHLDLPENVTMPGYARSMEEVYDGSSVLLSPSYLAGGIKTKVLEAFGYGTAVIGNAVTFEAMDVGDYPLVLRDDGEIVDLLKTAESNRELFHRAAIQGSAMIRRFHDPDAFAQAWTGIAAAAKE